MRIKICGITRADQGVAIANLGATALGFICVPASPRYISPEQIRTITQALDTHPITRVGVFADSDLATIRHTVTVGHLSAVQLHGAETLAFCAQVRQALPQIELIKAFRIRTPADLDTLHPYTPHIHTLLLDAYHPTQLGGTGQTLDWQTLQTFQPERPWLLAGGLTPDNIGLALSQLHPAGIDTSSGVERAPGDKDLTKVSQLIEQIKFAC
jgi:phosphoribosylanthranilate isomerase